MSTVPSREPIPSVQDVDRIVGIHPDGIGNLEITWCYYRLSAAFHARGPACANWCTFAAWASRQAGQTIRGEDLLADLERHAGKGWVLLQPVRSLWRWMLRRGLFDPETRIGRLVKDIHSPFDSFERASDAVARGNRKVFEEIGREFARYLAADPQDETSFIEFLAGLRPGEPPQGQRFLRQAFTRYWTAGSESALKRRLEMYFLANLEIGFHEQTRLQPEIQEALETPLRTAGDLGKRALRILFPASKDWWRWYRRLLCNIFGRAAKAFEQFSVALTRRVITHRMMTLAIPGGVLSLAQHLGAPPAPSLVALDLPDAAAAIEGFRPRDRNPDDCGADDWSVLAQRMYYILHLFRVYHEDPALLSAPFLPEQAERFQAGILPEGEL